VARFGVEIEKGLELFDRYQVGRCRFWGLAFHTFARSVSSKAAVCNSRHRKAAGEARTVK